MILDPFRLKGLSLAQIADQLDSARAEEVGTSPTASAAPSPPPAVEDADLQNGPRAPAWPRPPRGQPATESCMRDMHDIFSQN